MTPIEKKHRLRVWTAFALVYVFWGSTYLAIRIGVEHIPPLILTGSRFLVAGAAMLAWCAFRGHTIRLNRGDALRLFIIGVLLLTGGNVTVTWSEKYLASGLASLIVAVVPIWVAVVEGLFFRKERLQGLGWIGLLLGISGLAVLLWPKLMNTGEIGRMQLFAALGLIFASLSWACGSILSRHSTLTVTPIAATGWEMMFAGIVNSSLGLMLGEQHRTIWSVQGIGAIAYLIVFGSLVGFTAYIWLLEHVPTTKVATYAYLNPVVAVLLGWAFAGEKIDAFIAAGTVIIVAAVALVTVSKSRAQAHSQNKAEHACEEVHAD